MAYDNPEQLINRRETAALLGVREGTLRNWATREDGQRLRFFRIGGRAVRYRVADVMAYRDECAVRTEARSFAIVL